MKFLMSVLSLLVVINTMTYSAFKYWEQAEISNVAAANVVDMIYSSANNNFYAVLASDGIIKSNQSAMQWSKCDNPLSSKNIVRIIEHNNMLFALSNGHGVFVSSNGGNTWEERNNGITNKKLISIAKNSSGHIFVGAWFDGGVYLSTDAGSSWTHKNMNDKDISSLFVASDNTVYAGVEGQGIFKSTNSGNEWVNMNVVTMNVFSFYEDTEADIYASCSDGLRKLAFGTDSWTKISLPPITSSVRCMNMSPNGAIFLGLSTEGILRKFSDNDQWKLMKGETAQSDVNRIIINSGYYLIATSNGIFRSLQPIDYPQIFVQISPKSIPAKDYDDAVTINISCFDDDSSDVSGVKYLISNPLDYGKEYTTGESSHYQYTFQIPDETENGTYTINIIAHKFGFFPGSNSISYEVFHDDSPQIKLNVVQIGKKTLNIGNSYEFLVETKHKDNTPMANVPVVIANSIFDSEESQTTDENGNLTYTGVIPEGTMEGGYIISFTAEKEGFSSSETLSFLIEIDYSVGIRISENHSVGIYPNPASNHFNISGIEDITDIEIMSIDGSKFSAKPFSGSSYDISHLPVGMYLLKLFDGQNYYILRLIKQ